MAINNPFSNLASMTQSALASSGIAKTSTPQSTYETNKSSSRFSAHQFPADLGQHGISLLFSKYDYGNTVRNGVGRSRGMATAQIVLPLPKNLMDAFQIKVGEQDLGAGGAALVNALDAGLTNSITDAMDMASSWGTDAAKLAKGDAAGVAHSVSDAAAAFKYFSRSALDTIVPGAGMAIDISTGTAVNPHTTLNFDGVNLKSYTFEWKLSPKSPDEAETLKTIINTIRRNILPRYMQLGGDSASPDGTALGRALLGYPNIVECAYTSGVNGEHFQLFKPGMVNAFSTNYTPDGIVLHRGGKPAIVDISMTIQEARIHTAADYE